MRRARYLTMLLVRVAQTCSVRDAVNHESKQRNFRHMFLGCALVASALSVSYSSGDGRNTKANDDRDAPITEAAGPAVTEPAGDSGVVEEEGPRMEADEPEPAELSIKLDPEIQLPAPREVPSPQLGAYMGSGFRGRSEGARDWLVREVGGNAPSEAAVAAALKWFAAHQYEDGSWRFDHTGCPQCRGRCPNAGTRQDAPRAATALVLLPLLGAGQTHRSGDYQATVQNGLDFLVKNMNVDGDRGSLEEPGGKMYSHGLGAIVLCEAYGMTRDKALLQPAQQSLNQIAYAQDPVGGGWRYQPRQPGDTSVFGWQLMALKTGHMSYLLVKPRTVKGAIKFLDFVQAHSGAQYGYTQPATGRGATTAIGLLCRMYLGWKRHHPAVQNGVEFLSERGPSKSNMYFNYYATQVMRHYEGEMWEKWNTEMRDYLVNSQAKDDHASGSWYFPGEARQDHRTGMRSFAFRDVGATTGGRIYCTCLATLILEVYYRHPPIYKKLRAADDDFPL